MDFRLPSGVYEHSKCHNCPATIGLLTYYCTSKTEHPWNQQRAAAYFSSATFFSRHNVVREIQVQIKSNKIRELAVTVSAVHCKLPEGKQNQTKPFRMVFIFIERFFFPFIQSKAFWMLTYLMLKDSVWLHYITRYLQNSKEVATPFCRENVFCENRIIYFSAFCV